MHKTDQLKPTILFEDFERVEMRVGRIVSAPLAENARYPSRFITVDAGPLGIFVSVGQFALVSEEALVGRKIVFVSNFRPRKMGNYLSQALILGTPHPDSPTDQAQALPLWAHYLAKEGDTVF
ncbi:MAG: tRNA-binding protein [Calditrichaeota bacterium]|nr:tRNA-binding protein [Calditrichota bacterium]